MNSNQVFRNKSARYIDSIVQGKIDTINDRYEVINWVSNFTSTTESIVSVQIIFIRNGNDITVEIPNRSIIRTVIGTNAYISDSNVPTRLQNTGEGAIIRIVDGGVIRHSYVRITANMAIFRNVSATGTWQIGTSGFMQSSYGYTTNL